MGRKLCMLVLVIFTLLAGCTLPKTEAAPTQTPRQPDQPTNTPTPDPLSQMDTIYFALDKPEFGLYLDRGGDVDSEVISVGDPAREGLRTGNGSPLPAPDGNATGDYYLQFKVDDQFLFQGKPATRVQIEVEYLDQGTDHFSIEYDALAGMFSSTGAVAKTDSGEIRTATFPLCDAYFANRDNGADFRISDWGDGPETIVSVRVSRLADSQGPVTIRVDSCGANPYDDQPDSEAIQSCLDLMCSGDTALFTSPGDNPAYQGYLINKSIVLVRSAAKHDLTFDSTDPDSHAFLKATPELLGFVVQLFGRSGINNPGQIDNITLTNLDLDGNRAERKCFGSDGIENGIDDNWGSWLNECTEFGDPWCSAGTLEMVGAFDASDPWQDFESNPERWTTGLVIHDVKIANTECATAFGFNAAASIIDSVTIDTAGDHIHGNNCLLTDPDEAPTGWADGITMLGPENLVTNNTITMQEAQRVTIPQSFLNTQDVESDLNEITYTIGPPSGGRLPAHGLLPLNNVALGLGGRFTQEDVFENRVSYEHNGDASTSDDFTFTISDGQGATVPAPGGTPFVFNIEISQINHPPNVVNGNGTATVGTTFYGQFQATDSDLPAQELTFSLIQNGSKGTAELLNFDDGSFSYVPDDDASGLDTLLFQVSDGIDNAPNPGRFIITVINNQAPVISAIDDQIESDLVRSLARLENKRRLNRLTIF